MRYCHRSCNGSEINYSRMSVHSCSILVVISDFTSTCDYAYQGIAGLDNRETVIFHPGSASAVGISSVYALSMHS